MGYYTAMKKNVCLSYTGSLCTSILLSERLFHLYEVLKESKLSYEDRSKRGVLFFHWVIRAKGHGGCFWVAILIFYGMILTEVSQVYHFVKFTELYTWLNICVLCVYYISFSYSFSLMLFHTNNSVIFIFLKMGHRTVSDNFLVLNLNCLFFNLLTPFTHFFHLPPPVPIWHPPVILCIDELGLFVLDPHVKEIIYYLSY